MKGKLKNYLQCKARSIFCLKPVKMNSLLKLI